MKTYGARHVLHGIVLAFVALLPPGLCAQQATGAGASATSPGHTTQNGAAAPAPAAKATLADFGWLAGRWQGTWGPRVAQQVWTAPKAGVMLGTFQLTEVDKTLVLELYTMVEGSDGIKLYLRHFTPSLVAWEKPGPTTLNLHSVAGKSVVFVNSVDGQPKETAFLPIDGDTYISRSEIVPPKGEPQVTEITYHRVIDGAPEKSHKEKKHTNPQ